MGATITMCVAQHELHVLQVARVGREVVVDALFVADVDEDMVEDSHLGIVLHRYGQAMLEHILNKAECLEAHRLAACIRARDEHNALLLVIEQDIEGHHRAVQLLVAEVEQWMTRLYPVGEVLFGESRHDAVDLVGKTHLGAQEVYFAQEVIALEQIVDVGTNKVGNRREDADNLLPFLAFEFADAVVGLHHFGRLDIERLSGCRFVVNDAAQTALGRRRDGDDQTTVAHSRCGVLIDISLGLGIAQDAIE